MIDDSVQENGDAKYMEEALRQAQRAASLGEVPVGAVVTLGDEIVASEHNAPIGRCDPTAHAEILALRSAARKVGNYRLPGAVLFVTVEPCLMCVGALLHARVRRLVYGCAEPKTGAIVSTHSAPLRDIAVRGGVLAERSAGLLQEFFRLRRGA